MVANSKDSWIKKEKFLNHSIKIFCHRIKEFTNLSSIWNKWNSNLKRIKSLDRENFKIIVKNYKIFTRRKFLYNKENKGH